VRTTRGGRFPSHRPSYPFGVPAVRSDAQREQSPRAGFVAGLLGVRTDEVERVRGLFRASLLLGMGLVLFYGSANAIFLTRYGIKELPWVYIANAFAVIGVGLAYGAWSTRVPVAQALVSLVAAMTVSVAGLWLWATISDARLVVFLMAMWFRLLFFFAVLGMWEIASAVFDIRQAKRLFPAVALGMMVGFVAGGAITPILSPLLGAVNLVGLAAVFLALYTLDFRRLLRVYNVGKGRDAAAVAPAGPKEILADRFSRRMVWMKTVTVLLMYLTEYVFYEQSARTFGSESALAAFLGVFMGAMTIVMVLVTGLLSGRYISRFGIRTSTMTLPLGMVLVALPAGLYGVAIGIDKVFFALVCVALATNHVLGNAVGEPASAVLFQPMPKDSRMRVRLAVHGWLGSVALMLSGLLLLAIDAAHLRSVAPVLFAVAAIGAAGVGIALVQYRDYLRALSNATTLGFARSGTDLFELLDDSYVTDGRTSDDPASALASTVLRRSTAADTLPRMLPALLGHPEGDIVGFALDVIVRRPDPALAGLLDATVERDDLPVGVRARALALLTALDPGGAEARVAARMRERSGHFALASALSVPALHDEAVVRLEALSRSADASERLTAAQVVGTTSAAGGALDAVLFALLRDEDNAVVDAALAASEGHLSRSLAEEVFRHVETPAHRGAAIRALASGGAVAAGVVDQAFGPIPDERAADLFRRVVSPQLEPGEIIRRSLHDRAPSTMRCAGYEALASHGSAPPIKPMLDADVRLLKIVVAAWRDCAEAPATVREGLREEFELARRSIFAALGVLHDSQRVRDIETLAHAGDDDERANAIEALDVLLDGDFRKTIVAVLEPLDLEEATVSVPDLEPPKPLDDTLRSLRDDPRLTSWSRQVMADALRHPDPADGGCMDPTIARILSLRGVEIFSTLSFESLTELAGLVRSYTAPAGSVIIELGSLGQELYAVINGSAEARTPDGRVRRLDEGSVFGELAVLDPGPRSATVTAVTDCELIVVPRTTLLALADRRPEVMAEIAKVLARRLATAPEVVS